MNDLIWQWYGDDSWVLGRMVRGVVRKPYYGEIYFDEEKNPSWIWFCLGNELLGIPAERGSTNTFDAAITEVESHLCKNGNLTVS